MRTKHFTLGALVILLAFNQSWAVQSPEFADAVQTIRAVGPEGKRNAEASRAWRTLASADATALPDLLAAMDGANDLAINWLRAAVDTVASHASKDQLPLAGLGSFLLDTRHHPRARRLAFELISRIDSSSAEKLLPGMLSDPSLELRRDAVQKVIDQATQTFAGNKPGSTLLFQQALSFARDVDQIDGITKQLKELGQPVDLVKHFGFLTHWKVVGPFDNAGGAGFEAVYPPETKIDLSTEYDGKSGKVRWQDVAGTHEYGVVDMNKPCGALKGVAAYAWTEFYSDKAQPAELRLACENGWKIWFNGQYVFGRDEYHRMTELDQFQLPIALRPGRNLILVKVCQNEQVEDWTKGWEFQLRVTDALGTPIPSSASSEVADATQRSTRTERKN